MCRVRVDHVWYRIHSHCTFCSNACCSYSLFHYPVVKLGFVCFSVCLHVWAVCSSRCVCTVAGFSSSANAMGQVRDQSTHRTTVGWVLMSSGEAAHQGFFRENLFGRALLESFPSKQFSFLGEKKKVIKCFLMINYLTEIISLHFDLLLEKHRVLIVQCG